MDPKKVMEAYNDLGNAMQVLAMAMAAMERAKRELDDAQEMVGRCELALKEAKED